jgi:predicted amidohydrolase
MNERVVREGMAQSITVALAQLESAVADKKTNLEKATNYIENAAKKTADIIVFPELT